MEFSKFKTLILSVITSNKNIIEIKNEQNHGIVPLFFVLLNEINIRHNVLVTNLLSLKMKQQLNIHLKK